MSIYDDNVTLNLGSGGALVATDYVIIDGATAHVQYVKIAQGGTSEFQPIADNSPLSVVLRNSSGTELSGVGDSIPVDIVATGVTLDFNIDPSNYLKVAGSTDGTVPVYVAGDSAGGPVAVRYGTGGANVFVIEGTAGGELVGVSASNFDIRGLTLEYNLADFSGGIFGATGDIVGAYLIRGLSAGSSASGATAYDSVSVQGLENGRPVSVSQNVLGSGLSAGFTGEYAGTHDLVGVQGVSGGYPVASVLAINNTTQLPSGFTAVGFSGEALLVSLQDGIAANATISGDLGTYGFTGQAGLSGMPALVYGEDTGTWTAIGNSGDNLKVWMGNEITATISGNNFVVTGTGGQNEVIVGGTLGTYPIGVRIDEVSSSVPLPTGAATESTLTTINGKLGVTGSNAADNLLKALPTGAAGNDKLLPSRSDVNTVNQSINGVISQVLTIGSRVISTEPDTSVSVYVRGSDTPSTFTTGSVPVLVSSGQLGVVSVSGVKLKAHPGNADIIWISSSADGTQSTSFPLDASEEVFLEIDDLNKIYYWSATTGSTLSWIGS